MSCGHGQPLFRGNPAQGHVRAFVIVIPDPSGREVLNFRDCIKAILREPFISHSSIKSLDVGVLLRLPRLDIFHPDSLFIRPLDDRSTDVFWTVVTT